MTDFPNLPPLPLFVHTWTRWSGTELAKHTSTNVFTALTWPVANTAFYCPVAIPWPYPVKRVFWITGSSNTSTNFDFGIYTLGGTRVYSTGSTAAGTIGVTQYTTADFVLTPGAYYFALSCSSITAGRGGYGSVTPPVAKLAMFGGILQQASALPLPATMTAVTPANTCWPCCGVTRTTTGFS